MGLGVQRRGISPGPETGDREKYSCQEVALLFTLHTALCRYQRTKKQKPFKLKKHEGLHPVS